MSRLLPLLILGTALCGCAAGPGRLFSQPAAVTNPLFVASNNDEVVWERAVDVLHEFHFEIAQENRLARTVETYPRVGASLLEPWHPDAPGFMDRLEGTTQSIRRTVQLSLQPNEQQPGYDVAVIVLKEREDFAGQGATSIGAATFQESQPLQRNLDPVVAKSEAANWIPLGRDPALEQAILQRLYALYSR